MIVDLSAMVVGGAAPLPAAAIVRESEPDRAVRELYERLDGEIAARNPTCVNRGVCCRFGEYGHRLYVTAVELDHFLRHQRPAGLRPVTGGGCPYQVAGRCTAREHRPLGCRVFFCDPASQEWQPDMYERYLHQLKEIGSRFGIDYRYAEWLGALAETGENCP